MLTFDLERFGRSEPNFVAWMDTGGGNFFPFLNEGPMMANVRIHP
jgi:hypothetical protein